MTANIFEPLPPCPVCGASGETTTVGQIRCADDACEFAIVSWMPDTWRLLAHAAALLRACERLDAFARQPASTGIHVSKYAARMHAATHTAHAGYDMARDSVWSNTLPDALIALAARLEEANDEND